METRSIVTSDQLLNTSTERVPNQELDKDAFMQLLITQMQYQDPLNPMDNQEMMAQLAQFTALEQMKNVASMTEKQVAHGLVGQWVEYSYQDPSTGVISTQFGKVDYIRTSGSTILLGIGDHEISLSDVETVVDASGVTSGTTAFDLLGSTVQVVVPIEGTTENAIVEGEVLSIRIKDGEAYVVIGTGDKEVEVLFEEVGAIVEKPSLTGKQVVGTITNEDGEEVEVSGQVEYVVMTKDDTYVYVNGTMIPYDDLKSIS